MKPEEKIRNPISRFLSFGIVICLAVMQPVYITAADIRPQDRIPIKKTVDDNEQSETVEEKMTALLADTSTIWSSFSNCAILGDSRCVDFSAYGFLSDNIVYAENGAHIYAVSDHLYELSNLQPSRVYLCYGANDLDHDVWPQSSDYAATYAEYVGLLEELLPNTDFYINSILPAVGVSVSSYGDDYTRIDGYNEALKAMCEEKGYHYIDNSQIATEHTDLYDADGVHLLPGFYTYWGASMIAQTV